MMLLLCDSSFVRMTIVVLTKISLFLSLLRLFALSGSGLTKEELHFTFRYVAVVMRFFLRQNDNSRNEVPQPLQLLCDSSFVRMTNVALTKRD